jgi:hypothetical protein
LVQGACDRWLIRRRVDDPYSAPSLQGPWSRKNGRSFLEDRRPLSRARCYRGTRDGHYHRFQFAPVHAHINLLGWASLALAGLIYHHYPVAASTRLAHWHFWLHNLGLPVFMLGLAFRVSGYEEAERVIAVGALLTLVGVQLFALNLVRNLRPVAASRG